ncbi:patatin-like phospholipase domain-containing protein 4 [Montipora foliosa]|uniref:patatin-like phospholipase domain-containing protein 4 n=1 Tax=Montipora foliosa TaxID=591990 RepID=UPI0035F2044F
MSEEQDLNLSFAGCGFLGIYHLGVISCLRDNAPSLLRRVKCCGGASAGALNAMSLLLQFDISLLSEFFVRVVKRANTLTLGTLHPSYDINGTLWRALEENIPENAHKLVSGRLHISVTRVSDLKNVVISEFSSKEELVEALLATCFVPFWSGILPIVLRGKYYVDGGVTDNMPQQFTVGDTITISPFSGQCDICPKDVSSNDAHIDFMNTSIQVTLQNLYRVSTALFPPQHEVLFKIGVNGYRDTLTFLRMHYPDMLKKRECQPPSIPLHIPERRPRSDSTYSSGEEDLFSAASEDSDIDTDGQDGVSKFLLALYEARDTVTVAELWSCYFIRQIFRVVKLAVKPHAIFLRKIYHLVHNILQVLPKVEKTGSIFLDHLLSMIYMVIHTYQDKHEVQSKTNQPITGNPTCGTEYIK